MFIYLPYVEAINLLNPPKNLQKIVEESFARYQDDSHLTVTLTKIEYLDMIRKQYIQRPKSIDILCAKLLDNTEDNPTENISESNQPFLNQLIKNSEDNELAAEVFFFIVKTVVNFVYVPKA